MDSDDIKDYAISSIPFIGGVYSGVREGRAANRYANRQAEDLVTAKRRAAIERAMTGRLHSGPAFSVITKDTVAPDMTKIGIQKGLSNLATQWATAALTGGAGA